MWITDWRSWGACQIAENDVGMLGLVVKAF